MTWLARLTALIGLVLSTGCATRGEIEAAWYYVDVKSDGGLRIAVRNGGPSAVDFTEVRAYAGTGHDATVWKWSGRRLPAGGLLVLPIGKPAVHPQGVELHCLLPTHVELTRQRDSRALVISLQGTLPNALTEQWLRCDGTASPPARAGTRAANRTWNKRKQVTEKTGRRALGDRVR